MDANRLDSLARSLAVRGPRRTLLRLFTGGALGLTGWPHADDAATHNKLKKCKKIEDKKKRKACIKKAKKHNATHAITTITACTPNCAGKTCGDDGCGTPCGTCTAPFTCQSGQCACPNPENEDFCGGNCVPKCIGERARDPGTCGCCTISVGACDPSADDCCSGPGRCDDTGFGFSQCTGFGPNQGCTFDAQCQSGDCHDSGPDVGKCD